MNILFDGNYLFHRNFSIFSSYYKEDMCDVLKDPEKQQVLIRKCVIDMCHTIRRFKNIERVAFVIDSHSWRYSLYEDYKYALTKVKDPSYEYFLLVLNMFEELLRKKGIMVSRIDGAEGDDLLCLWSIYFDYCLSEEVVIITGDSDIRQIMTKNVSIFNNNSKNLKLYCVPEKEDFWNEYFNFDISVESVIPFEILLYKVIMGDTSDNIPHLKKGFGKKAFEKFIKYISPYKVPEEIGLSELSDWIALKFSEYVKIEKEEVLSQITFNLTMTWLSVSVYNKINYKNKNNESLIVNMLNDIDNQKDKYNYNKEYTLENFYNLLIK